MAYTTIYSKAQVQNMINNLENALASNDAPVMVRVKDNVIDSVFYAGIGWYCGPIAAFILSNIGEEIIKSAERQNLQNCLSTYRGWLRTMGSNFVAVQATTPNGYKTINGVKFYNGQPAATGFQKSNGNWVLPY